MRRIIFISFFATLILGACKKQLLEKTTGETLENQTNAGGVICTGNTWVSDGYYRGNATLPLVYNNKTYVLDQQSDKLFTFDGTNWDSIPIFIPFTGQPVFAFTIGDKGYLGGYNMFKGVQTTAYFWQFSFTSKTWSSKPVYPGKGKRFPTSFTIGNKAYVVGGQFAVAGVPAYPDGYTSVNENWEYNQATNLWTKKAGLPFIGIHKGAGFSIGNKGYFLNGSSNTANDNNSNIQVKTLYEYNSATNAWSIKTSFPGQVQDRTHVFVVGNVAYAGGGENALLAVLPIYYKYSPATNAWVSIANAPGHGDIPSVSFVLNSKCYFMDVSQDAFEPAFAYVLWRYTPMRCYTLGTSQ